MARLLLLCRFVCLSVFSICLSGTVSAATAPTVSGTVTDPSGAVLLGAHLDLLSNVQKVASTVTNREGRFLLSAPVAGTYALRISARGFKTYVLENLQLSDAQSVIENPTLRLDALSENVTVTATATPTLESHLGAAVTILSPDEYAGTNEAQDALRWIPGLQMTQTGQFGGTTGLYIRGGNDDANEVLIDGIPANDIGGAVEFADIASSAVAKIEVLRGPNSSAYGSDAMAGVVSLTTATGTTPLPQLTYLGEGGNFAASHNEGSLGGKWKTLDYFSDYSRFDTSNSIPNDRFHIGTASGNFGWALLPNAILRATVRHDQMASGEPNAILLYGIPDDTKQANEDSYFGVTFDTQSTQNWHNLLRYGGLRLRSEFTDFAPTGIPYYSGGSLQGYLGAPVTIHGANGYTVSGQAYFQYPQTYPYSYPTSTDRDFVYAQSDYRIHSHLLGLVAFNYEDEHGYSGGPTNSVERGNYSYTLLFQGDIKGRLFYTMGTGVEDNALYGVAATPRISLAYLIRHNNNAGLLSGTRIRASFGKGVKEPSIFDQTDSLYAQLAALPNGQQLISQYHIGQIGAEWSRTYDAGMDQELFQGRAKVGITYFHNEFTNGIEYIPSQGLLDLGVPASVADAATYGATVNSQAFRAQGIETEAQFQLTKSLFARGGYTYLAPVIQRSFTSDAIGPSYNPTCPTVPIGALSPLVGARPFRRAPHSGYFGLSYTHARISSLLTGTLVGRRDDSDFLAYDANFLPTLLLPNRNLDGAYQRLDLNVTYAISHRLEVVSSIQNLLSQHYSEAFGYPALPFTIRSGVQLTLGGESWKLR
jgi:iron complex outermembrane receptor protein/vitamin B12 transporter